MKGIRRFTIRNWRLIITSSALFVFTFFAVVSLHMDMGMTMDDEGNMSNCPFMVSQISICQMTIDEHIRYWQTIVTSIVQQQSGTLLGLLALALFFALERCTHRDHQERPRAKPLYGYHYLHKLFSYLLWAFADGVLHPKIYQRLTA